VQVIVPLLPDVHNVLALQGRRQAGKKQAGGRVMRQAL
jgi:hypothetical protein